MSATITTPQKPRPRGQDTARAGKVPPLPSPEAIPVYPLPKQGELQLWLRSYAPFKTFGGGYTGDDRGPSTDVSKTSRVTYILTFDYAAMKEVRKFARCDESHGSGALPMILGYTAPKAEHVEGGIKGRGVAEERTTIEPLGRAGQGFALSAQLAASMPLVIVAAAIDIQLNATFKKGFGDSFIIEGNVAGDAFPNCEVFLRDASGATALLHSFRTRGGHAGPYQYLAGQNFRLMGAFKKVLRVGSGGLIAK